MLGFIGMIKAYNDEEKYAAKAHDTNVKALNKINDANLSVKRGREMAEESLEKLANRKKGILKTSMKRFVSAMSPIMNVIFDESSSEKFGQMALAPSNLVQELNSMVQYVAQPETKDNMMLNLVLGGLTFAVCQEFRKDAKIAEREYQAARAMLSEANAIETQSEAINTMYYAVKERSDRIAALLSQLNILFLRSIKVSEELISDRGLIKENYTFDDIEYLRNCANFAAGIKEIIESPLLDGEGKLTQKSLENIEHGNELILQMQRK